MVRALALVAVREKKDEPRQEPPLVLAGGQELIQNDLSAVDEVAKLRLPEDERLREVPAKPVLEAQRRGFGERGVHDLEGRSERPEGKVLRPALQVDEGRVALVERPA